MKTEEFDYELDERLIAQTPIKDRDRSRLMVINRDNFEIENRTFNNVIDYLEKGDTLVLNDTKVLPARLLGIKEDTFANIEILLLKDVGNNIWEALCKPSRRVDVGTIVSFNDGLLKAKCVRNKADGLKDFELIYEGNFYDVIDKIGVMPLPPYIHEKLKDRDRYQTIYAKNIGSSAAPTAGLHFTKELLQEIADKGVNVTYITLHVGLGTFRPVSENDITKHVMHTESYSMSEDTASILNETKVNNKKVVAVGTTSVRTLETIMGKYGTFKECTGDTNIFIYPGYKFKGVDMLITNFHLPKSTLLMLVSAFSSKEIILNAYKKAVAQEYRFFSFGDAMLIK